MRAGPALDFRRPDAFYKQQLFEPAQSENACSFLRKFFK
jgi:hypothetical protein